MQHAVDVESCVQLSRDDVSTIDEATTEVYAFKLGNFNITASSSCAFKTVQNSRYIQHTLARAFRDHLQAINTRAKAFGAHLCRRRDKVGKRALAHFRTASRRNQSALESFTLHTLRVLERELVTQTIVELMVHFGLVKRQRVRVINPHLVDDIRL